MVSILSLSVVDCGFKPRLGQTKDCWIVICCFSAALRFAQNQDNVFKWSNMSTRSVS